MVGKWIMIINVVILIAQIISAKNKERPLVPRLKYSPNGRHLDDPESITYFLAEYNLQGFPIELFYRSLEEDMSLTHDPTTEELVKALRSPEAQRSLETSALDHFADVLNEPEAHTAVEYSGKDQGILCSYSWLSWVPWLDCPTESRDTSGVVLPQKQLYAQCLVPKSSPNL